MGGEETSERLEGSGVRRVQAHLSPAAAPTARATTPATADAVEFRPSSGACYLATGRLKRPVPSPGSFNSLSQFVLITLTYNFE
jgi:hypothetical protein